MGEVGKNAEIVRRFVEDFLGQGDLGASDATMDERIQGITNLEFEMLMAPVLTPMILK